MKLGERLQRWFDSHPETGCWLANFGLGFGGGDVVVTPRQGAQCPLRRLLPAGKPRRAGRG